MTKAEYNKQLDKARHEKECGDDLVTLQFYFKWGKTLYKLFGLYEPYSYIITWRLYRQNTDDLEHTLKYFPHPDQRKDIPFTILYTMAQFEQDLFYN